MYALTLTALSALLLADPLRAAAQPPRDTTLAAVDRIFAPFSATTTPGCAVGVARGGEVVLERGYGMANLETDTPIRPGSIFHVASVSKQFTAAAILLLAREGKLSLDDEVRRYVPELPDYGTPITIRQMLQHTSGLRDQWELLRLARGRFEEERITEADVMDIVPRQRALNFEPGTEYTYSNTGYTLAAVIVKRVSGKSLKEFADERIFRPLGMTSTHFHDDYTMLVRGRTSAYAPRGPGQWRVSIPNFDTYGATSLYTTVGDLLKWEANLDAATVGDREMYAEMETSAVLANGDTTGYGLGLALERHRGERLVGHGGADAGYRSWVGRIPSRQLAVTLACNYATANAAALGKRVMDVFLGVAPDAASAAAPPAALPEAELARWAGVFASPASEAVLRISVRDGGLILGRMQGPALLPEGPGRFRVGDGPTRLVFPNEDPSVLEIGNPESGLRPRRFERREPAVLTPRQLAEYAGTYRSDELGGAVYTITATDSTLVLRTRTAAPIVATPVFADVFEAGGSTLRFTRSRAGIAGFLLSGGRVRRVEFVRVSRPR